MSLNTETRALGLLGFHRIGSRTCYWWFVRGFIVSFFVGVEGGPGWGAGSNKYLRGFFIF